MTGSLVTKKEKFYRDLRFVIGDCLTELDYWEFERYITFAYDGHDYYAISARVNTMIQHVKYLGDPGTFFVWNPELKKRWGIRMKYTLP